MREMGVLLLYGAAGALGAHAVQWLRGGRGSEARLAALVGRHVPRLDAHGVGAVLDWYLHLPLGAALALAGLVLIGLSLFWDIATGEHARRAFAERRRRAGFD